MNELKTKQFIQAKTEEKSFNIGDKVRHIINKKVFEKGNAHWSKTIYTITDKLVHSYILNNGKQPYKYYELMLVTDNEKPNIIKTRSRVNQPTFEQMKKENTINRRLRKDGVDITNIVREMRERKPTDRYKI